MGNLFGSKKKKETRITEQDRAVLVSFIQFFFFNIRAVWVTLVRCDSFTVSNIYFNFFHSLS